MAAQLQSLAASHSERAHRPATAGYTCALQISCQCLQRELVELSAPAALRLDDLLITGQMCGCSRDCGQERAGRRPGSCRTCACAGVPAGQAWRSRQCKRRPLQECLTQRLPCPVQDPAPGAGRQELQVGGRRRHHLAGPQPARPPLPASRLRGRCSRGLRHRAAHRHPAARAWPAGHA